ncbi:MAG: hypothetical protein JKY46_05215 [Robiginitomaculum sp.]|nr:hypothetical protein [Robiginitomaculum sp.]
MSALQSPSQSWRISRQITLAVILTLLLQGATALIWAGSAAERISQLEQRSEARSDIAERLAALEAHMVQTRQSLDRIERKLDGAN